MLSSAPITPRSHVLQLKPSHSQQMDTAPPDSPGSSRWTGYALAALLLLSFALRAWDAGQGLRAGRYYDERYTFRNVSLILRQGNWRPGQAYYLSLSYLPQTALLAATEALHRATGLPALSIYGRTSDRYSPTAYLLARLCNVAYGVLSLLMIFLIGRRIFSAEVGLLAAAILSAFPRHVLSSTQFKPDILVLLLTLVAFYWTLDAALNPSRRRFLKVGLAVGLAVATKYTGIGAALPITGFVAARGWRDRRLWLWLVLAGAVSVVVFVILNPYLGVVLEYIPKQLGHYSGNARARGSDHAVVLAQQARFLIEHHGPLLAAFAAAGLIGIAWKVFKPRFDPVLWTPERRLGAALALGHFVGYSAFHAAAVSLFRGQNYLLVVPFSSLFAAWAILELWRLVTDRRAILKPATAAVVLIPTAVLAWEQGDLIYDRVVPTTWQVAGETLSTELQPLGLREVIHETRGGAMRLTRGADRAVTTGVDRLGRLEPGALDRADAEVFLRSRFHGKESGFYRGREDRLGSLNAGRAEVVSGKLFRSRGEPVVLLLHPWMPVLAPEPLGLGRPAPGRPLAARLPDGLKPGEVASLTLWVPREAGQVDALRIEPGGRRLPLYETGRRGKRRRLVTTRFALTGQEARVRVPAPAEVALRLYRLELYRWRR
jgi:4-amino-4-deoxy-L-arabinose transferase-like glycosyltransferase